MKRFLHLIGIIAGIIMVIWDLVELLAVPAILILIGLLNSFPWQYYVIVIGGYLGLFIIGEMIVHFVFKALNKKYTPFIERKLGKISDRFSKKN